MTNHARCRGGSHSRTSGGIRNDCSRSHATKRWPITKWLLNPPDRHPTYATATGDCESGGRAGNAARRSAAPTLCLCTRRQRGLTARMPPRPEQASLASAWRGRTQTKAAELRRQGAGASLAGKRWGSALPLIPFGREPLSVGARGGLERSTPFDEARVMMPTLRSRESCPEVATYHAARLPSRWPTNSNAARRGPARSVQMDPDMAWTHVSEVTAPFACGMTSSDSIAS